MWASMASLKARLGSHENSDLVKYDEPDVPEELRWLWRSFWRLSEGRSYLSGGMGAPSPLPISFTAVLEWADYYDHDEEMTYVLEHTMRSMDKAFIDHWVEKHKK